jgi:hypothetical protein
MQQPAAVQIVGGDPESLLLERGESQSIGGVSRHGGRGGQSRVACKYYEKGRWDPPGQLETHFVCSLDFADSRFPKEGGKRHKTECAGVPRLSHVPQNDQPGAPLARCSNTRRGYRCSRGEDCAFAHMGEPGEARASSHEVVRGGGKRDAHNSGYMPYGCSPKITRLSLVVMIIFTVLLLRFGELMLCRFAGVGERVLHHCLWRKPCSGPLRALLSQRTGLWLRRPVPRRYIRRIHTAMCARLSME